MSVFINNNTKHPRFPLKQIHYIQVTIYKYIHIYFVLWTQIDFESCFLSKKFKNAIRFIPEYTFDTFRFDLHYLVLFCFVFFLSHFFYCFYFQGSNLKQPSCLCRFIATLTQLALLSSLARALRFLIFYILSSLLAFCVQSLTNSFVQFNTIAIDETAFSGVVKSFFSAQFFSSMERRPSSIFPL